MLTAVVVFTACMAAWYGLPAAYRAITRELARAPRRGLLSGPRQDATTVPQPDVLPRQGRHRRPDGDLPPGAKSATGILRALNLSADQLPAIPRGPVKR